VRLVGFDLPALSSLGRKVRDLYVEGRPARDRILRMADDAYVEDLVQAVAGQLGGKVGVAPRVFLRKLIGDVLDRIDQFEDFDPKQHYKLTLRNEELTRVEAAAVGRLSPDDIELDLG
jgi:hypothetical protein